MRIERWGVIGPGSIAGRFADALTALDGQRVVAVAGRSEARATAFARRWSRRGEPARLCGSAEELAALPEVDAVYVATPHHLHAAGARAALDAGKPVLCEKPLTASAATARPLVELARARRVFLMEALWTRFLPAWNLVEDWLRAGAIGDVRTLRSKFCFTLRHDPTTRHFDPAQAGGALLDVGVYNVSLSRFVAGLVGAGPVQDLDITGRLGPTGVDVWSSARLGFASGLVAHFECAFDVDADNAFEIEGERGTIRIPAGFWQAEAAELHVHGRPPERRKARFRHNGFEYQLEEVLRCVAAGAIESPVIPHEDTLATLELIDALRARL